MQIHYRANDLLQQSVEIPDWNSSNSSSNNANAIAVPHVDPSSQRPSKKQTLASPTHRRPPVPNRWKSEISPSKTSTNGAVSAPIDLSLADDDASMRSGPSQQGSHQSLSLGDSTSPPTSGATKKNVNSPVESADLLYEYFPLSLDDW